MENLEPSTRSLPVCASKGNRGSATSLIAAASIVGLLVGAFVANGMSWALGAEAMTAWGWRIPFLFAAPWGFAIYIRMKLEESPDFKALEAGKRDFKSPLRETLRHQNSSSLCSQQ